MRHLTSVFIAMNKGLFLVSSTSNGFLFVVEAFFSYKNPSEQMAASLRTKAVERSIKSNSAAYYSYIDDSKNPVLQSFEAQISDFKNYVVKQSKSNQSIDGRLYVSII
jgi:hypothetical protein